MLIQRLLPGPVEGTLSFVPDIGNLDFSCDPMPGDESWKECPCYDKNPLGGCGELVTAVEKNCDDSCSVTHPSCSQVLSSTSMSGSSTPLSVYYRKKLRGNSLAICPAQTLENNKLADGCNSAVSSEAHSGATKDHVVSVAAETEGIRSPLELPVKSSTEGLVSKSGSYNGCPNGEEPCSEEGRRSDKEKCMDICCIDDSCSSSKLNLDLLSASLKTDVDDTGECSSSGALISEREWENMSEKDVCIAILRSQGLLETETSLQDCVSPDDNCMNSDNNCFLQICKVCDRSETSLKMLICDQCDDPFHVSCCNPRIKKIPTDEWFCYSCLKKKRKLLKENSSTASPNIDDESSRCRATSKGELGPVTFMLKDNNPYRTSVKVGPAYQVEVPDWSGPVVDEVDSNDEPKEMTESEYLYLLGENSNKNSHLSSIGNWLQCQEVIEGIDGTICGKWRRAPLFEVQTDDWECFRAVLWDPSHADCAVPQELPTDEVLKQLKYIEMLRPRLAARKRKLDQTKSADSQVS